MHTIPTLSMYYGNHRRYDIERFRRGLSSDLVFYAITFKLEYYPNFISLAPETQEMKTLMITPEGLEKLKAELDHLWRVERPDTTQKVSWAVSLGDRSENADYHYNKKRLREIDKRILYLRKLIDELKVVHYSPFQEGKVMFGAWVEIENDKGMKNRFRIVGGEELIGAKDYISMDSPMAIALLKKKVGDEAVVKTPARDFVWRITKIEYQK